MSKETIIGLFSAQSDVMDVVAEDFDYVGEGCEKQKVNDNQQQQIENEDLLKNNAKMAEFLADYFTTSLAFNGDNYYVSVKKQNTFGVGISFDFATLIGVPFLSLPLTGKVKVSKGREQMLMVSKLGTHHSSKSILFSDLRGNNYAGELAINFSVKFDPADLFTKILDLSSLEIAGTSMELSGQASVNAEANISADISVLKNNESMETESLSEVKSKVAELLGQYKPEKLEGKTRNTSFCSVKLSAGGSIGICADIGGSAKIGDISKVVKDEYKDAFTLDDRMKKVAESSLLEVSASAEASAKLNLVTYPEYYWCNNKLDNGVQILRYGTASLTRSFFTCGAKARIKASSSFLEAINCNGESSAEIAKSLDKEIVLLDTLKNEELLLYYKEEKDRRGNVEYKIIEGCGINYVISLSMKNLITLVVSNNSSLSRDRDIDKYISDEFEKNSRKIIRNLSEYLRISPRDLQEAFGNVDLSLINDVGLVKNLNDSCYIQVSHNLKERDIQREIQIDRNGNLENKNVFNTLKEKTSNRTVQRLSIILPEKNSVANNIEVFSLGFKKLKLTKIKLLDKVADLLNFDFNRKYSCQATRGFVLYSYEFNSKRTAIDDLVGSAMVRVPLD